MDKLIQQVQTTRTLEGDVEVYKDAYVDLMLFDPTDVYPMCMYVLQDRLDALTELYEHLLCYQGVDIFHLEDIFEYKGRIIAPPILEVDYGVPVIVDGIHRFYLARQMGISVTAVYIEGASLPLIAYPVTWEDVQVYTERPEDPAKIRKMKTQDTSDSIRKLYRDFSHLGSSGRRPRKEQNG